MKEIFVGALAGLFSTVLMDVVSSYSKRKGWTHGISANALGGWILGIFSGRLKYETAHASPTLAYEIKIGFISHYSIGVALGGFYAFYLDKLDILSKAPQFALIFGFVTNVFPWFILFPALGYGYFGLKGPKELKLFRTSLLNHLIYGMGLFLFYLFVNIR
ncbi:MAG: DUF2938 family protein [Bdellovibrio sp.]